MKIVGKMQDCGIVSLGVLGSLTLEGLRDLTNLEEQHHAQHRDRGVACGWDGRCDEDDAARQEGEEDVSRLHPLHHQRGDETSHSEQRLRNSKKVGTIGSRKARLDLCNVVDEESSDGDLRSYVAELRRYTPEECVLVAEGLVLVACRGG